MLICLEAQAGRAMYVDNFENILGDPIAENTLLAYAESRDIETLLLYGLHIVNINHNLANPTTNFVLADFISKAKTTYSILYVGATAENGTFFTNVVDAYNLSRNNSTEKFDIYNLEFEYWSTAATGSGGYYCTTYLTPNSLPCTVDGAFQFYLSILQTMNSLSASNPHPVTIEAYVGWPNAVQASAIGTNLDRLRLHAYVSDPNTAFSYTANRLIDFANGTPDLDVSIIFSSEAGFMQNWLETNSMAAAENIFSNDWSNGSTGWLNNINLEGFTYFAYSDMTNVLLPVELNYFKGQALAEAIQLTWETSTETDFDYFEIERQQVNSTYYETIGRIQPTGNSISSTLYQFLDRNPNVGSNYYRLKQVDYGGSFEYSNVITIIYDQQKASKIYPTLVEDMLNIESSEETEQASVYDVAGKKITELTVFPNKPLCVNLENLKSGIYLLVLKSEIKFDTFRFIKL